MLISKSQRKVSRKLPSQLMIASVLTLGLFACDDNNNNEPEVVVPDVEVVVPGVEYSYSVTVTNLTYAQPLSHIAVALHGATKMWKVGEPASIALEKLAEGGDNTDFIALENNIESARSADVVLPGTSVTINISTTDITATYATVATMLINTNDAFSGLTALDLSEFTVDQAKSWNLNVYDSGTEKNNEAAGTIPGPVDSGAGYNATRDDTNVVSYHSGVVSQDDGLSGSVLTEAHRFDNPAVKLTITRTK